MGTIDSLLVNIYNDLDYKSGDLVNVEVNKDSFSGNTYIEKGQWLDTCRSINETAAFKIDKLFFVQNNPVIVFIDASTTQRTDIFKVYNSVWSLARPRLVFIENSASVTIYDLAAEPARSNGDLKPLSDIITDVKQILGVLQDFQREKIESGELFSSNKFDLANKRADQTLINDLKKIRAKLFENGLNGDKLKIAHSLIGRSIFIRYLEDRHILTKEYFQLLADGNQEWLSIIETPIAYNFYRKEMADLIYPRVLSDHKLTFTLFRKIAEDFNGDSFLTNDVEEGIVNQTHLALIQRFLIGDNSDYQAPMFLWAYRFDIIPIDLISSIYEEFYHSENLIDQKTLKLKDGKGTHYTPSSLVEYLLSRVLSYDQLKTQPRVLDPACGSGVFLVESFRRMVRFSMFEKKLDSLNFQDLVEILKQQIAGIEINEEAVKISAFSLYLTLLNFLKPPSILEYINNGGKLPFLIASDNNETSCLNILVNENSFSNSPKIFESQTFDLIVGNPPWGTPSTKNAEAREALDIIVNWCKERKLEFPDKEPSHAFIWKSLEFAKPNGQVLLLISSGVLFKFSKSSNKFKQQLLAKYTISEVINFSHVRSVFFSGAISPFLLIRIQKIEPKFDSFIPYITLKRSYNVDKNKIVLMDKNDFKTIKYSQTTVNDVWKIYYWGNEYDFNLINSIRRFNTLSDYASLKHSGQGFQQANSANENNWLANFKEIPIRFFDNKYEHIDLTQQKDQSKLEIIPAKVKLLGKPEFYKGHRILIRRGILQSTEPKGQIICRLEYDEFAYRHSLICIKLNATYENNYPLIIGILWSSLFKYYMFMTASTWGTWHQEIHKNEVLEFPIALPENDLKYRLLETIQALTAENGRLRESRNNIFSQDSGETMDSLERQLDEIVFDLYQLTDFERNLIKDRCKYDIDFYYRGFQSVSHQMVRKCQDLSEYIDSFTKSWGFNLTEDEEFEAIPIVPSNAPVIGVIFKLKNRRTESDNNTDQLDEEIKSFSNLLTYNIGNNIFVEGMLRHVSDNEIVIIKRNRKSLWSRTEAKIDADATLLNILKE